MGLTLDFIDKYPISRKVLRVGFTAKEHPTLSLEQTNINKLKTPHRAPFNTTKSGRESRLRKPSQLGLIQVSIQHHSPRTRVLTQRRGSPISPYLVFLSRKLVIFLLHTSFSSLRLFILPVRSTIIFHVLPSKRERCRE